MQKAYKNLKRKQKLKTELDIHTTDYYVRFWVTSDAELEELEKDSLILFNYPLDYELIGNGTYSESSKNTENGYFLYTSVPVDYQFNDVDYEILENLYLPETILKQSSSKSTQIENELDLLETEALTITTNTNNDLKRSRKKIQLLRRTWGLYGFTTHSQLANFFLKAYGLNLVANALEIITKFIQPDMIISAGSAQGTAAVYSTCFHELAHASHYTKAGNQFWVKYINYIITYGAYGDGTGKNVGLCALSEAWAYDMGYRLTLDEFKNIGNSRDNSVVTYNGFENFTPLETGNKDDDIQTYYDPANPDKRITSWEGWIPTGIMNDIVDTNADLVRTGFRDNVSGYTYQDLFDALDSNVDTPQKFRDRLLRENANRDKTDLVELFEAYYWN